MKAAYILQTGGPNVIQYGNLPMPEVQQHEVLVRIAYTSINPIDTYARAGAIPLPRPYPYIPGCDFAGTIESVGAEVTNWQVGQRVWGTNQGLVGRQGCSAEYAAIHQDWLNLLPDSVSEKDAAAIALVGITAHLGLFKFGNLVEGETVFVSGGTGGVGSAVIQLAKASGCRVITTAGTSMKQQKALELGADVALDYADSNLTQSIKNVAPAGVNLWFETHREQDFGRIFECLRPRGRAIVMAGRHSKPTIPIGPFYVKNLSLHGFAMFNCHVDEIANAASLLMRVVRNGQFKSIIDREINIEQLDEGHAAVENGTTTGKVVVRCH
jgi:NADPH:quinone reductase